MALFTAETAAEMGRRSAEARKNQIIQLRSAADPVPFPADDSYAQRRLFHVREDIEKLREQLMASLDDAQQADRYASAIAKLSEIERQLAGRPMPGSLKPSAPKPRSKPVQIEPISVSPVDSQSAGSGSESGA